MAIEVPTFTLVGEDSPVEIVEVGEGLQCRIIGIEDLIIDRMNAFKHRKSEMDGEMVELLIQKYGNELDWAYLERKAALPENDVFSEIFGLKQKTGNEE